MEIVINNDTLVRLGLDPKKKYNPVPIVAFDTVDFGPVSTALGPTYSLFDPQVVKGSAYRNFVWTNNAQAFIFTAMCFVHDLNFTAISSGTTNQALLLHSFERHSIFSFGQNEKPIFQTPMANIVPWIRGAGTATMTLLEKEKIWEDLPYQFEVPVRCIGETTLSLPSGYTSSAGGSSLADAGYIPQYPTGQVGGAGNISSFMHYSGVFQFKGIRLVQVD